MAVVMMPEPIALVSSRASPTRAPLLASMRSSATNPLTDRPYLGSSSLMVWPPAMEQPASTHLSARQNLPGNLNAQAIGNAQQVHGMARPSTHGVDVRQRVGRGDLAKQKRIVDHRREEVDGLHEAQVIANAKDARIVGGIEPHEQVVVMHIG